MPYDEGNRAWKAQVLDREGQPKGLLTLATCEIEPTGEEILCWHDERRWTGRPRAKHRETLLQWKHSWGIRYYLLIHFGSDLTDDDYVRETSAQDAATWLVDERYDLPPDLTAITPVPDREPPTKALGPRPLSTAQQEVWDMLAGNALLAKEIAARLTGHASEDAIRKRIDAIRKLGRKIDNRPGLGYYRPDKPPLDPTGAERASG